MVEVADDSVKLRRSLSFWQATASGIGIVIGAGIYVLVGTAAGEPVTRFGSHLFWPLYSALLLALATLS